MDCSLPGFSVHGILQARVLEWVPFPSPGHLPDPGMEPRSPALQADALPSETPGKCSLKNILSVKHTSTDKRKERREEGRKRNKEGEKER